jgi:hypothetical protein
VGKGVEAFFEDEEAGVFVGGAVRHGMFVRDVYRLSLSVYLNDKRKTIGDGI